MNKSAPHPGYVLARDFLDPLEISQAELARHLDISTQRLNEIINGKRGVTPETAILFSQALDTSPEYWLELQMAFDLSTCAPVRKISSIL